MKKIWTENFFLNMGVKEKLFYLYITDNTNMFGSYKICLEELKQAISADFSYIDIEECVLKANTDELRAYLHTSGHIILLEKDMRNLSGLRAKLTNKDKRKFLDELNAYTKSFVKLPPLTIPHSSLNKYLYSNTNTIIEYYNTIYNTYYNIYNKVKKSKKIPDFQIFCAFFLEKGYTETLARKVYDYYEAGNWTDSRGNEVKNWKQKVLINWMKDEYRVQKNSSINELKNRFENNLK